MSPPRHIQAIRYALIAAVLVALVLTALALPWNDVVEALDPWVDGLRRAAYP